MLKEKLNRDLIQALKGGDKERTELLRFLLAQVHNREIEKQGRGEKNILTDPEVEEVLRREAKKRREAIELFTRGGRLDLASHEEREALIIAEYLPQPLDEKEIEKVVEAVIACGEKGFNAVMRAAMEELKGRAEGRIVAEVVKKKLPTS